eukprot:411450-Amphidinium_carterae.2
MSTPPEEEVCGDTTSQPSHLHDDDKVSMLLHVCKVLPPDEGASEGRRSSAHSSSSARSSASAQQLQSLQLEQAKHGHKAVKPNAGMMS